MKYSFKELVDIPRLQALFDELYAAASISSAVVSLDGEFLASVGWQQLCTDFHRRHPGIEKECIESATKIRQKIDEGEPFVMYQCPRGLTDASSPLIIGGNHVANILSGQVFLEPLTESREQFFREQARKFGFDETAYIEAVRKVPVFTEQRFKAGLSFLVKLALMITDMSLTRMQELEATKALRESAEQHRTILQTTTAGFWILNLQGQVLEVNDTFCRMSGYRMEELLTMHISDLEASETPDDIAAHFQKIIAVGQDRFETRQRRKDGNVYDIEVSAQYIPFEGGQVVAFLRDITERKAYESEREITLHLLQALHRENDLTTLLQDVTALMQRWSGCEAVGIRFQDGPDFPYVETRGFPQEFVEAERRLCAMDENGKPITDDSGNPILECMCGNVICGRFNPELPFFSKNGSFWSNCTTDLLASTTEADRQARTRNRCNGEGYESVALIPLRIGNRTIGLLQFNDHRRNRFDARKIALFESLASSLAVGLSQRMTALALRASEEDLKKSQQIAHVGSWRLDIASNQVGWSDELYKMCGFDPALPPPPYTEHEKLFTPESWNRLSAALQHTRCTGIPYNLELETVRKDGSHGWMWAHGEVTCDANGATIGLCGAAQDITDRKQAEAERERLQSAIEQSHEAIVITDTNGTIQYVNPSFEKTTGYTKAEAIGQNLRILKSGVQGEAFYRELWESISSGKTWVGHLVNRKKDGSFFTEDASISPVKDFSGAIINYVGVKRDITRELEAEKRISQSQRIEAIGALAGGIAHDFNNLLFPIAGMSEMLLEDLPKESPEHENAEEILKAARRAGDLVKQILSFSRQSGQQKIPVRIQQILKEVLKLSRSTIPTSIEISSDIPQDCGLVLADPSQIHQIAMNLVTNAYHAVEEAGGSISILLKEIVITGKNKSEKSLEPGRYAVMTVSDTGHGIDPLIMNRIFEPYFTTKPQGKGTGLGLSVVYGIVKGYGGDIRVTSQPGRGASFAVYLPLMPRSSEEMPAKTVEAYPTGHEQILLVDDEEVIVRLETQTLERLGYKVTSYTGSIDALAAFTADPDRFDVVITDMTMPNMTGDQLARKLLSTRPGLPIIICTGFSEKMNAEKAKGLGIRGLLMKPVVKSDIAVMIRKVLDEANPSRQPAQG